MYMTQKIIRSSCKMCRWLWLPGFVAVMCGNYVCDVCAVQINIVSVFSCDDGWKKRRYLFINVPQNGSVLSVLFTVLK
jgi:hypothetical protein